MTYETVLEKQSARVAPPPLYKVILLNDDFTPMDFVVDVLRGVFKKSEEAATQIMLEIHQSGAAVCGVYQKDIAETKTEQVKSLAESNQHPLRSLIEPDSAGPSGPSF